MIAACCLLLSCMEDEASPRTRAEFCRDWASAACNEEIVSVCQAADAEACRQAQEDFCRSIVPDTFVDDHGQECLEAVADAYSDGDLSADELITVRALGAPCDQLSGGSRDEGETCVDHADCDTAAGFACVVKANRMTKTCQMPELVDPGERCRGAAQVCTTGFFCDGDNCIAARDPGEPCMHHEECGEDGFCDVDGECAERFEIGDPCDDDAQCRMGICYDFDDERMCTDRIVLTRSEPLCSDLR